METENVTKIQDESLVDISGLEKADVLSALYDDAKPLGMGFLHYDPAPLSQEESKQITDEFHRFDYLKGRVMKVSINLDQFDPRLYDQDNGTGAAKYAIDKLRAKLEYGAAVLEEINQKEGA